VEGYWASAEAIERQRFDRWLRTVRAIVDQEPRQKGRAGRRESQPFRAAVREAITLTPDWPKPRATLALELAFHATARQPPSLWRLPKHYLDLLGAASAPTADPRPVLYSDDQQVKLLFATLSRRDKPGEAGRIALEARTRASAIADMQLAGELIEHDADLEGDTRWAEADPEDDIDQHDENRHLPEDLAERFQFHDKARYQAMLLSSNDRLVRDVFFHAAAGSSPESTPTPAGSNGSDRPAQSLSRTSSTTSSSGTLSSEICCGRRSVSSYLRCHYSPATGQPSPWPSGARSVASSSSVLTCSR